MWSALRDVVHLLGALSPRFVLAMLGLYSMSLFVTGARYRTVLLGVGAPISLRDATLINWCCIFVSNVTPGKVGGEVFRVLLLKQQRGVDVLIGTVAQGYDRLTDLLPLGLMVLFSMPTLRSLMQIAIPGTRPIAYGITLIALVLLVVVLLFRVDSVRARLRSWSERFARYRIARSQLVVAQFLGFILVALDLLRLTVAARAFGFELGIGQALAMSAVMLVGGLAPTLGGLGVIEGGLTAVLCLFGASLDKALAITLLERSMSFGLGTGGGGLVLLLIGGGKLWRSLRRSPAPDLNQSS
jgi:uncharacterized membrane protein YbhN (UPF0104 family)